MKSGSFQIVILAAAIAAAASSAIPQRYIAQNGIIFLGATQNKELYISDTNLTSDFTQSLVVNCPLRFQMSLAAIETPEEVAILDSYFKITQGNSSDAARTSGISRIGAIPAYWANNGQQISEFVAPISGPWPSGAGSSPTYANHNCIVIQRVCHRPRGSPPGCYPSRTEFIYDICNFQSRFICEKKI